jgi:exodeoxyribonuclease VII small subunit
MTDTPVQELAFEDALAELEGIVVELERGDIPLEQTVARFERGVALSRRCEDRLNEAGARLAVLLQQGDRVVEQDPETGEVLAERPTPDDLHD